MKALQVCNGEVVTSGDVCEQCKFYYPAHDVYRLVYAVKNLFLEQDEWNTLADALAPFEE